MPSTCAPPRPSASTPDLQAQIASSLTHNRPLDGLPHITSPNASSDSISSSRSGSPPHRPAPSHSRTDTAQYSTPTPNPAVPRQSSNTFSSPGTPFTSYTSLERETTPEEEKLEIRQKRDSPPCSTIQSSSPHNRMVLEMSITQLTDHTNEGGDHSNGVGAEEGQKISKRSCISAATVSNTRSVDWDGPNDPTNPQNWSKRFKWLVTFICIIMTLDVTFASSSPTSAIREIMQEFEVKRGVAALVTTNFLLGFTFGPLFWGPGSELIGRRPIFLVTMISYTLFYLGQALAQNIQTLLISRFLSGFFAVAPLTNCAGVIADIWPAGGRGPATSLFTASVFMGPVLGPIISGYIVDSRADWRLIFWVMMGFAGACTLLTVLFLPETYKPVLLLKKAKRLCKEDPTGNKNLSGEHETQDWSFRGVINRTVFRPFKMLATEPILVIVTAYLSIVYGLLYALFQALPIIFIRRRGFTIAQSGLTFIGLGVGTTIGSFINFYLSLGYPQLIKKWKGFPPAENRLVGAMIGAPCLVVGIFWMGWTGEYAFIPWYWPELSTVLIGMGISLIFMSFLAYLVDTYLIYSASAFSANTICRSAIAAAFPLFTVNMFTAMGVNWACTFIGLVTLLFMPGPFLLHKYGAKIRKKSRFAPCVDLKIKKEVEEQEKQGTSV